MKSSKWKTGALTALALAAAALVSQAQAGTVTLSITPASPTTLANEPVSVSIIADGLPAGSGGFSLLLDYGNLSYVSFTIGAGFGAGADGSFSPGDLGGTVSLVVFEDLAVTDPNVAYAAQNLGGPFTLATVTFTGPATPGDFTLGLRNVAISDFLGNTLLACTGAACGNIPVPEPMTPLLVAAALGALALTRKKQLLA